MTNHLSIKRTAIDLHDKATWPSEWSRAAASAAHFLAARSENIRIHSTSVEQEYGPEKVYMNADGSFCIRRSGTDNWFVNIVFIDQASGNTKTIRLPIQTD